MFVLRKAKMFKYLHILAPILILDGLDSDSGCSDSGSAESSANASWSSDSPDGSSSGMDASISDGGVGYSLSDSDPGRDKKKDNSVPPNQAQFEDMQQIPFQARDGQ